MTDYMNMRLNGMSGISGMVIGGYMSRGIDLR
jgi:nucleoside permease NupC